MIEIITGALLVAVTALLTGWACIWVWHERKKAEARKLLCIGEAHARERKRMRYVSAVNAAKLYAFPGGERLEFMLKRNNMWNKPNLSSEERCRKFIETFDALNWTEMKDLDAQILSMNRMGNAESAKAMLQKKIDFYKSYCHREGVSQQTSAVTLNALEQIERRMDKIFTSNITENLKKYHQLHIMIAGCDQAQKEYESFMLASKRDAIPGHAEGGTMY